MREAYLFRLDDACPTWRAERWLRIAQILENAGVRPLVAAVPDNQDPDLVQGPADSGYRKTMGEWLSKGWPLGLHGYTHSLRKRPKGLVPRNDYGEWAGDPLSVQQEKMKAAWTAVLSWGWEPEWWVAPAHNFDRATLSALESETPIRCISDGWARGPYRRYGFSWVPQQLGKPRRMGRGIWTICLHPNSMDEKDAEALEKWLSDKPPMAEWREAARNTRSFGLSQALFGLGWGILRKLKGNS